jgi:hypothetical protein
MEEDITSGNSINLVERFSNIYGEISSWCIWVLELPIWRDRLDLGSLDLLYPAICNDDDPEYIDEPDDDDDCELWFGLSEQSEGESCFSVFYPNNMEEGCEVSVNIWCSTLTLNDIHLLK